MEWIFGFTGSLLIAGGAYWKRSLSASGMMVAVVVGTLLFLFGSMAWFGTLIAFFISSTLWSKWKQSIKASVEGTYEKTGRRDAGQVLANGGLAVLLAAINEWWPHPTWWSAFIGVIAAVNADTWATEIGALSRKQPRSILTGKKVPRGTSGGVSTLGILASVAGGSFIGLIAWLLIALQPNQIGAKIPEDGIISLVPLLLTGMIAGTFGSLFDSYLGARWQVMYHCQVCEKDVERKVHCGVRTEHVRGISWMNNDVVNLLSSVAAGGFAVWMASIIQ